MSVIDKKLKICPEGHRYYKTSDCPTCPKCEALKKPVAGFHSLLSAPARRAMENKNIRTLNQVSKFSEKEILEWHGIGPSTIPTLKKALKEAGLSFKK